MMYCVTLLAAVAGALSASWTTLAAQGPDDRLRVLGKQAAAVLDERYAGVVRPWKVVADPGCEDRARDMACRFGDALPAADVERVIAAMAAALGITAESDVVAPLLQVRRRNLEQARAAGVTNVCSHVPPPSEGMPKILSVIEARAAGDTVQASVAVTQISAVPGCSGGMHLWLATLVDGPAQLGATAAAFTLQQMGHFQILLEKPDRQ